MMEVTSDARTPQCPAARIAQLQERLPELQIGVRPAIPVESILVSINPAAIVHKAISETLH
jgi:hypothetical protein